MTSDEFLTWNFAATIGFDILKSIQVDRKCKNGLYRGVSDITLILINQDDRRLIIKMYSCKDIKIDDVNNSMRAHMNFEDIRSWQHEGVSYKIYDLKDQVFSCCCKQFDVVFEDAKPEI